MDGKRAGEGGVAKIQGEGVGGRKLEGWERRCVPPLFLKPIAAPAVATPAGLMRRLHAVNPYHRAQVRHSGSEVANTTYFM
jgi:hypothetical protein